MARRAHINPDTFRKYLGGYQRCGKQTLENLKLQVQMEEMRLERATEGSPSALHDDVVDYAKRLLQLSSEKRDLAKKLIAELQKAECAPAPQAKDPAPKPKKKAKANPPPPNIDDLRKIADKAEEGTPRSHSAGGSSGKPHAGDKS